MRTAARSTMVHWSAGWRGRAERALYRLSVSLLFLAWMASDLEAQSTPALAIATLSPSLFEISWPTNFSDWQLATAPSLTPPVNWQPVQTPAIPVGGLLVAYISAPSGQAAFFRLQRTNSCAFQANPPVIPAGGSSVLSWCQVAGTSYCLSPGPCPASSSPVTVSPTVTTLYTLIASNALEETTNYVLVTVQGGGCAFASVTGWDCSVSFSYEWTPSTDNYSFIIREEGHLTFHLAPTTVLPGFTEYSGYALGNAQINDEFVEKTTPPPNTTTLVGSGAPQQDPNDARVSLVTLDIDCTSGTYSFSLGPAITATETGVSSTVTMLFAVGRLVVSHHALPATVGPLSGSGFISARSLSWTGGGDYYLPDDLAQVMFVLGVANDNTAGSASANWTFTPTSP